MKPLRSDDPRPRSVQFSHFGVLNDGSSSKGAFFTSTVFNIIVLLLAVIVGNAVKNEIKERKLTSLTFVTKVEPPKPPPPKLPPPPKPLPEPPKPIEPPKIQPPPVPLPPTVKPIVVPTPKVNLTPPAPKAVIPPPAPKLVSLANAHAASVVNHDANPSPVRLGHPDSPVNPTGPAVSRVNLSAGMPGMPASNTGNGPRSTKVDLGNGSPQGTNINGRSAAIVPVKGLSTGVPGGTGTGSRGPVSVQFGQQQQIAAAHPPAVVSAMAHPPVITYTPRPTYSAEASNLHLEGEARVNVRLDANGTVQVLGLVHGLGHGLDQSALAAAQGIRFRPATDASGHPVDFPTVVIIRFAIN